MGLCMQYQVRLFAVQASAVSSSQLGLGEYWKAEKREAGRRRHVAGKSTTVVPHLVAYPSIPNRSDGYFNAAVSPCPNIP